jgi:hypothetical protein
MIPPLVIRNVEVMTIMPLIGRIDLVIHLNGKTPQDFPSMETTHQIMRDSQIACNYLKNEGFLDDTHIVEWKLLTRVVLHPNIPK